MAPLFIFMALAIQSMIVCFASAESSSTGFTLPLIPRFSPESPFYRENLTDEEISQELILQSEARATYLAESQSPQHYSLNNIQLKVKFSPLLFVTRLGIGTPAKTQVLALDTASHIIWTQCQPCTKCFNQTTPIFNPNQSSTYRKQPCDSSCVAPGLYSCVDRVCKYQAGYLGASKDPGPEGPPSSKGEVSKETFTFDKVGGGTTQFTDIVFGCGKENTGFAFIDGKEISGIVGLNGFRHSLVQQLRPSIQGRFSYCLTTNLNKSSLLKFGEAAVLPPGPDVRMLEFVKQNRSPNYYLNLIGISVGTQRLPIKPRSFAIKKNGSGGCFIDSGASVSFLDTEPYRLVTEKLDRYYTEFRFERVRNSTTMLEYCYSPFKPKFRYYIGMTLHFGGSVDYVMKGVNTFRAYDSGYFCLAFLKGEGRNIIGAWQQQNMRIAYDLNQQKLHFKPDDCSKDAL